MKTFVTLASYTEAKTAYFLKNKLEDENIECFLSFVTNPETFADEIKIQVVDTNVEKAIQLILKIREEYKKPIEQIDAPWSKKRILVPTGFSEKSANAGLFAIHLAEKIKGEIKFLHVYENPIAELGVRESATYLDYIAGASLEAEKNARQHIMAFSGEMDKYIIENNIEGVSTIASTIKGNTVQRIKGVCDKYRPDVMVLCTQGNTDNPDSILSGLAKEMVNGLEIPVFAIPCGFPKKMFENLNILYATDFNERDHNSLEALLDITDSLKKKITCVHIDTNNNPAQLDRIDELNIQLKHDYSNQNIVCRLFERTDIVRSLKDFAQVNEVNLISFTVRKRSIFDKLFKPDLFKQILQEAGLPILIFPS